MRIAILVGIVAAVLGTSAFAAGAQHSDLSALESVRGGEIVEHRICMDSASYPQTCEGVFQNNSDCPTAAVCSTSSCPSGDTCSYFGCDTTPVTLKYCWNTYEEASCNAYDTNPCGFTIVGKCVYNAVHTGTPCTGGHIIFCQQDSCINTGDKACNYRHCL
jgi:hypothetical protein